MKKMLFRAKRSNCDEIIEGQLLWVGSRPHIIRECDMEEDGHHLIQSTDCPTWVDESTIEPVINEEEIDKYIVEIKRNHNNPYHYTAISIGVNYFDEGVKAGYRKVMGG